MKGKSLAVFLAGGLALVSARALAHHSFAAEFDAESPVTVKGVITSVRLENPHSWFYVNVAPHLDRGLMRLSGGRLTTAGLAWRLETLGRRQRSRRGGRGSSAGGGMKAQRASATRT